MIEHIFTVGSGTILKYAVAVLLATCSLAAQTGKISGTVVDDKGNVVAGAVVTAALHTAVASGAAGPGGLPAFMPFTANALSGSQGGFEIDALPAGSFYICVENQAGENLNPCLWSNAPTSVAVPSGGAISGVALVAKKGVTVIIRVTDAKGLLAANPAADDIIVGTGNGTSVFVPARVIARDGMGKTMALVVPPGQAVGISVYSGAFSLADQSGNAFTTPGVSVPVTSPLISPTATFSNLASAPPNLTVQVTGAKAAP